MPEVFTVEIITPDQTILKSEANEVVIPSFEGQMGILKIIPLITFKTRNNIDKKPRKKIFCEEGTIEFSNNNLLILTSSAKNLKNFDKKTIDDLINKAETELKDNSTDKEKYIASYKIDTLKKSINN